MPLNPAPKQPAGQQHHYASQVGINHPTRPPQQITPEQLTKHNDSKAKYPHLPLSQGEFVIEEVRRHPIGILSIWFITALLIGAVFAAVAFYGANLDYIAGLFMAAPGTLPSAAVMTIPALILSAFFALGGIVATIVYEGNRFYITNESIVQLLQPSLFNTKQQVVNLINVEDASSEQVNIIEQILNYGTINLSTQGEQTRYRFRFVANPKRVTQAVNDAAERAVRVLQGYPIGEF